MFSAKVRRAVLFKFSEVPWYKYNLNSSIKLANWCVSADVKVNSERILQRGQANGCPFICLL